MSRDTSRDMSYETDPSSAHGPAHGPLSGTKVVEMSIYFQAATASLQLANLGADVVKIERVGHQDHIRDYATFYGVDLDERGRLWMYSALNRGKRSLAIDVTSAGGAEAFQRLIAAADVFITNLRPAALVTMGADPETLRRINPRLVYARGGGYGFNGPMASDPCQDTVGMAFGGLMQTASGTEEPYYPPGSLSDILTGTNLASAVMAGLYARSRTGEGSLVGTSQLQSLVWLQMLNIGVVGATGEELHKFNRQENHSPLFSVFPTADGWIAIATIHEHQWPPLAQALGLADLPDDPRFGDYQARSVHHRELTALLEDATRTRSTQEWWATFKAAGVWSAPVNSPSDLVENEQVLANEFLVRYPDGFLAPSLPFEYEHWSVPRVTAASYGEHSDEVLAELGYSDDQIVTMKIDEAVW